MKKAHYYFVLFFLLQSQDVRQIHSSKKKEISEPPLEPLLAPAWVMPSVAIYREQLSALAPGR